MMRLRRLDLTLFGHFVDKSFDFGPRPKDGSDFHIIYGPNEAGKTTTMEGFLRLLYGFDHREKYAFKHQRANLNVGGMLEIDGVAHQFTRLPSRANSLLNAAGDSVPETTLQGPLAGLSQDDYRKLLCLDDATIEGGGDEIANSQGDIGRLLFSAAAGVNDLSKVLDLVTERTTGFYRKGGSKSTFAGLKRQLDDLNSQIKEHDVTPVLFRRLRQDFDTAQATETQLREERRTKLRRQTRLQSLATALPLLAQITALERALQPAAHYPETLDVDPEELVAMLTSRGQLLADQDRLNRAITGATQARDAIPQQSELLRTLHDLDEMQELKIRFVTADTDLPKRCAQRDEARDDMRRSLTEIGIENTGTPEEYVLPDPALSDLETRLQILGDSETTLTTAQAEQAIALGRHETAQRAFDRANIADTGPDLGAVLVRFDAGRVVERFDQAENTLRLATRAHHMALAAIHWKGQAFEIAPELPLTPAEAATLARDIDQATQAVASARETQEEAQTRRALLNANITVIEGAGDFVTDHDATATRGQRDALWQAHNDALSPPTASAFEAAMRADDAKSSARQAQAKELGELRQIRLSLAEAVTTFEATQSRQTQASARLEALSDQFEAAISTLGLSPAPSPEAFADWTRNAKTAQISAQTLADETRDAADAIAAAKALKAALATALDEPDAVLGGLVAMAREQIEARAETTRQIRSCQDAQSQSQDELLRRQKLMEDAEGALDLATQAMAQSVATHFSALPNATALKSAIPVLRRLREFNERLIAAHRQIAGMERDQRAFTTRLNRVLADYPDLRNLPPVQAFDNLSELGTKAQTAQDTRQELTQDIADNQQHLAEVGRDLTALDDKVRVLAGVFAPNIPTQTLEALRIAVRTGADAIAKRAEIAGLTQQLVTSLNVPSRTEAIAVLDGQTEPDISTELKELALDLTEHETRQTTAIAARATAQSALNAITGDAEIATRVAQKRTIEVEMQAGIRRYLQDRFSHRLADQAIRRYRDSHRSAMMKAAERAFAQLTDGAYSSLSTRPDGTAETLIALQAADGTAKPVQAMSKGTRFQLYLALRAAAYEQMAANGTVLPFFCDDVFETFDETRTRAACGLMHQIGKIGQAVYLTHHRHVVDIAKDICGDDLTVHVI